jgi:LysM repeat protein
MKLTKLIQKDTLQAVTRRMTQRVAEEYAQEPGIKLSSAFLVVLVLHVVAVGGIYAFNSIKAHKIVSAMENSASPAHAGGEKAEASQPSVAGTPAKTHRVRAGETLEKIAAIYGLGAKDLESANELHNVVALRVGQELRIPARTASKPAAAPKSTAVATPRKLPESDPKVVKEPSAKDAGDTYTVVKGDTPAGIARKLGVKQSELLKLNKIDDPRKLQIGQKLHVPARSKS